MIEIRACAAFFSWLVAAENDLIGEIRRFAISFIRRSQIRGHDEMRRNREFSAIAW
jgi:hypothetical protein